MKNLSRMFLAYLALSVLVLESAQAKSFKGPELHDSVDYKAPHHSLDRLISFFKVQNDRLLADEALLLKHLFLNNGQKKYGQDEARELQERFLPCASEEIMDPLSGC